MSSETLQAGYLLIPFLEILIQGVKRLQPEEIARKIQHFDQELCSEVFLSELKRVLPSPEQVHKKRPVYFLHVFEGIFRWANSMCTATRIRKN